MQKPSSRRKGRKEKERGERPTVEGEEGNRRRKKKKKKKRRKRGEEEGTSPIPLAKEEDASVGVKIHILCDVN